MIIFGIIGFVLLFWFALVGLWKLIPWLIILVMITTFLGFVIDHWVIVLILIIVGFGAYGAYLEAQEKKNK